MEHGEDEIKRERRIEQFAGEMLRSPDGEQAEHRQTGDRLGRGSFSSSHASAATARSIRKTKPNSSMGRCASGAKSKKNSVNASATATRPSIAPESHRSTMVAAALPCQFAASQSALKPSSTASAMKILFPVKIFFTDKKFAGPADLQDGRAERGQRGQEMPAAVQCHENQPGVEDGNVAEQAERIVLAGGKQNRRQKAAEHSQDGDDQGIEPDGHEGRCGDERHEQERRHGPKNSKR